MTTHCPRQPLARARAVLIGLSFAAACGPDDARIATTPHAIVGASSTTPIALEPPAAGSGTYREVVHVINQDNRSCTGTIVGPYAVLTAEHCFRGQTMGRIRFADIGDLFATAVYRSPYLQVPYRPAWWVALDDAQRAAPNGRQNDWPAQHDLALLFVPHLTPELLAEHQIEPALVDPWAGADRYRLIGVGSNGATWRQSANTTFRPANPGTITADPRDGYLTRVGASPVYGITQEGDSGGPTLGLVDYSWPTGSFEGRRHLVGTTQNPIDMPPLAYDPGIQMTPNQRRTVRLNTQWVKAIRDDADGDGLPTLCDPDPTVPGHISLCPRAVGTPHASSGLPFGQLQCKPGYVAVGLSGRAAVLVDQLALRCRAVSCFHGSGGGCDEYTTEGFGGDGGTAFAHTCASGQMLAGIRGRELTDHSLRDLAGRCVDFPVRGSNRGVTRRQLPTEGNLSGQWRVGTTYQSDCRTDEALVGFAAVSTSLDHVTGLQPICQDLETLTPYAGGQGGTMHALRCPDGHLAVGTQISTQPRPDGRLAVAYFGLQCWPRDDIAAGVVPSESNRYIVHGSAYDAGRRRFIPALREPLATHHAPASVLSRQCRTTSPGTYALHGLYVRADDLLRGIEQMTCRDTRSWAVSRRTVNDGGTTGSRHVLNCPSHKPFVRGVHLRSGWLTDGLGLECTD